MEYNGRIKENIDALREEVATLRKEFAGVTGRLQKMSRTAYASGNEKLGREAERLYQELGEGLDTVRMMGAEKIDRAEARIAKRPFLSVMIAFLLGILAGKLIDRE
jgi:ElaB/YqjD/DUF883 family membrane-anchored ribosome-binding protein